MDFKYALAHLNPLWKELLQEEFSKPYFLELTNKLTQSKDLIFPSTENIFKIYNRLSPSDIKVVIIGQDPYHGMGQAHGLAFSVSATQKVPPSLRNIFKELSDDLSVEIPINGDLTQWVEEGVFLLNTVLTVEAHKANSHAKYGWNTFTKETVKIINKNCNNIVFILWGASAQKLSKYIDTDKHYIISSAHPSPLSVYRGFWGSKPFSKTNTYLKKVSKKPIEWV